MRDRSKDKEVASQVVCREKALEVVEKLREKYGEKAAHLGDGNEAEARLYLIDRILEALGWSNEEFNPETPVNIDRGHGATGYIDYLVTLDSQPQFIVEAKKAGITFGHSQQGQLRKMEYELRAIRSSFGSTVSAVIDQATKYSKGTGVPYAVITNGAEWILIQAITYGKQTIESLKGVYFGNLLSERSYFNQFWELLSKPSVVDGSLERHFSELNSPFAEYSKIPQSEFGEIRWSARVGANSHLRDFYDRFLDEMIDPARRVMLEHCFVTSTELEQYQGDLKRILRDATPSYIPGAISMSPENGDELLPSGTGDKKGRVILVTGSVGCGKSTFVTKALLEAKQKGRFENITVDLIDEVDGDPDLFNAFLWEEVAKIWRKNFPKAYSDEILRKVFKRQIEEFRATPRGVALKENQTQMKLEEASLLEQLSKLPRDFLEQSWKFYSRSTHKGIVVFIDNVDRASETYQRLVYAFSHKLARETGVTVIITMREVTYFRGTKHEFLDVRLSDRVFHLETPDIVRILAKRLQYAEAQLELDAILAGKDVDHRLQKWRSLSNWDGFRDEARKCIQLLKTSFLASQNGSKLTSLLASIAWHDVRYFLDRLRSVHSMLGNDASEWSMSEVIAALMMPPQVVGNQTTLPNIFIPANDRYPCYFLKTRILCLLIYGKRSSELLQGTNLRVILGFARRYGYQERWSRQTVQAMVRERLLECVDIPAAAEYTKNYELNDSHSFRASPLAVMLIEHVAANELYLSIAGNEIPFHEEESYHEFVNSTRETFSLLAETGLDRSGLELLVEAEACSVVADYLCKAFRSEQPLVRPNLYPADIAAVEDKLKGFITRLQRLSSSLASASVSESALQEQSSGATQLTLSLGSTSTPVTFVEECDVPIPNQLRVHCVEGRDHLPKIFWALVKLRAQGKVKTTGSEVTRIINQYLVDDLHRVEPTNISRSLRGRVLRRQAWLTIDRISERKNLYGLEDNWCPFWTEYFDEYPPTLQ